MSESPGAAHEATSDGFTLVELLVAIAILALITQLAFSGLRFGIRVWDRVSEDAERIDNIVAAQRFLRARLSDMSRPHAVSTGPDAARQVNFWFLGKSDAMEFVSPWRQEASVSGLYRFAISLSRTSTDNFLNLEWRPEAIAGLSSAEIDRLSGERELLGGVSALELSYFGASPDTGRAEWYDEWASTGIMPSLVRIQLDLDVDSQDPDRTVLITSTGW